MSESAGGSAAGKLLTLLPVRFDSFNKPRITAAHIRGIGCHWKNHILFAFSHVLSFIHPCHLVFSYARSRRILFCSGIGFGHINHVVILSKVGFNPCLLKFPHYSPPLGASAPAYHQVLGSRHISRLNLPINLRGRSTHRLWALRLSTSSARI